jgi:hypothetical protein
MKNKVKKVRGVSFDAAKNRWRVRLTSGTREHIWWTTRKRYAIAWALVFVYQS